jgi:hypothetical protein
MDFSRLEERVKKTKQRFFNALSIMENHRTPSETSEPTVDHWSTDVEKVLYDIRANSEILSKHHKAAYMLMQQRLVYFRIPLIVLSAVNSVFSVGLNTYMEQTSVSTINCLVSLLCACISSVELFLQIQKRMEVELASYHGYYLLGTRISATLKLDRQHREAEGITFLNQAIADYNNLFEQSNVNVKDIDDQLVGIINPHVAVTVSKSPSRLFSRLPGSPRNLISHSPLQASA